MPSRKQPWFDVPFPPLPSPGKRWTPLTEWRVRHKPTEAEPTWFVLVRCVFGDFQTHETAEITECHTYATEHDTEPTRTTSKTKITPPAIHFAHYFKRRRSGRLRTVVTLVDTPDVWREAKTMMLERHGSDWRYYGTSKISEFQVTKGDEQCLLRT